MKKIVVLILCLGCLFAAGCMKEPEGPGQRIGRGVDDIMGGISDMNNDPTYGGSRESNRDRRDDRTRDRAYDNRSPETYATPRCDPLYDPGCDDPHWQNRDTGSDRRGNDRTY